MRLFDLRFEGYVNLNDWVLGLELFFSEGFFGFQIGPLHFAFWVAKD